MLDLICHLGEFVSTFIFRSSGLQLNSRRSSAFIQSLYRDEDKAPFDAADGVIDIANLLPDTTAYWRGFPLKSEPVPFRMNLLLQERTKLVPIMADIVRPYNRQSTKRQLLDSSSATAWRLHEWQEALPAEVAYSNGMPVPLYELQ